MVNPRDIAGERKKNKTKTKTKQSKNKSKNKNKTKQNKTKQNKTKPGELRGDTVVETVIFESGQNNSKACSYILLLLLLLLLLHLQRSTAVQVRSSVRLMPQNQPSGRGLLPSPTAWSSDQHPVAMLADVSRHTLGRTEGRCLGFGQLVRTRTGKCLKCQSSADGHSDHNALCAGGR